MFDLLQRLPRFGGGFFCTTALLRYDGGINPTLRTDTPDERKLERSIEGVDPEIQAEQVDFEAVDAAGGYA